MSHFQTFATPRPNLRRNPQTLPVSILRFPPMAWAALSVVLASLSSPLSAAQPLSVRSEFAQRLAKRHSGIVDGQPLRVAIAIVATPEASPNDHVNVWLDRNVNPDAPVSPGALGPTRYASINKIAGKVGCVCYPVHNCVLIGRPIWVASLARDLVSESPWSTKFADPEVMESIKRNRTGRKVDIRWPSLTTPAEALKIVAGHSENANEMLTIEEQVPHDLWPAIEWRGTEPEFAMQLILGQLRTEIGSSVVTTPFSRRYRFPNADEAANSIRQLDPYVRMRFKSGVLELTGTPAAHQLLCRMMLSPADGATSNAGPRKTDDPLEQLRSNKRTFSLTVDEKPAGPLIKALIAQLGLACEFADDANPQLQILVSLSAKDQTVWQLVRLISEQASLKIEGSGEKLLISVKEES